MPTSHDTHARMWPAVTGSALRVAFGLVWAVNAALTWTSAFATNYVGYLHNAAQGQASWSAWWFDMWITTVTPNAEVFIFLTRLAETALAVALLLGFARKTTYILGALFSLLIWSTAEGFGGPYAVGASNMGAAITYVMVFVALMAINYRAGKSLYSIDNLIEKYWPAWRNIAEWNTSEQTEVRVAPWNVLLPVLLGLGVFAFFLIGGLYSSLHVKAASPQAAAAAVSPLALASKEPVKEARDATLPPLTKGDVVHVEIATTDKNIEIASGVQYRAWTFGDTVPGPVIRARVGQTIKVTLINRGTMPHSVDFHSAITPPSLDYVDIMPGEKLEFEFKAKVAGAFVYHCGTPPVLLHMGNGMYGAMIVDPAEGLPPADRSYVLVQSEWFTKQVGDRLMAGDYDKMLADTPDEVVFNGVAKQYVDHPLEAHVGERVRFYVVNAGPNGWSAFHVIGTIFDRIWQDGNPKHYLEGVQTFTVPPGGGAVFDVLTEEAGHYPFVDHNFSHLMKGAVGVLNVTDPKGGKARTPKISKVEGAAAPAAMTMDHAKTEEPAGPYKFDAQKGADLYGTVCAACHQSGGEGMAGTFPPLKGNKAVLDADPTKHINVVLHGLQGEAIDGVAYSMPMPPFGGQLSDTDVANIINHERTSWGNKAKQITPDQVKALRK